MDLNSDLGEGFGIWHLGDDDALLAIVTSANVACGYHAGDASTMRRVCLVAAERGVAIGAQVSYRDLAGFGRRRIDYAPNELRDDIVYQVGALAAFARRAGERVRYLKPHGALYNTAAVDEGQAAAVVEAVLDVDPALPLLCQPGSVLAQAGEGAGLRVVAEGFGDRAYLPDGRLAPRTIPGAVIHDPDAVVERTVRMATDAEVVTVDGSVLKLRVDSICLHGDTPGAVTLAGRVRDALLAAGVTLAPFA